MMLLGCLAVHVHFDHIGTDGEPDWVMRCSIKGGDHNALWCVQWVYIEWHGLSRQVCHGPIQEGTCLVVPNFDTMKRTLEIYMDQLDGDIVIPSTNGWYFERKWFQRMMIKKDSTLLVLQTMKRLLNHQ